MYCGAFSTFLLLLGVTLSTATYKVDTTGGLGRTFDGIGGLSGGGVGYLHSLCIAINY